MTPIFLSQHDKLITLITATYNSAQHLETQLREVSKVKDDDIEWIIIDGASTDDTLTILEKYNTLYDYFVSERDNGIYSALNKALKKCTGKYIMVAHSDDIILSEGFCALKQVCQNSDADIVVGAILNDDIVKKPSKNMMFYNMTLNHTAMAIKRSLFDEIRYDEDLEIAADYDLALKAIKLKKNIKLTKHVVAYMRTGGTSSNSEKSKFEKELVQTRYFGPFTQKLIKLINYAKDKVKK